MDKMISLLFTIILFVSFVMIIIAPHNEQRLGNEYWYDVEGCRVFGPNIDIPPIAKVVECTKEYIIVEQHPKKGKEEATYGRIYNYPHGRDTTYYWIIFKKKTHLDGAVLAFIFRFNFHKKY